MTSEPAMWELLSRLQAAYPALDPWMSTCLAGQLPPQWRGALPFPVLLLLRPLPASLPWQPNGPAFHAHPIHQLRSLLKCSLST